MDSKDYRLMTWDWKDYVDFDKLASIVKELSDNKIHIKEVNTGSDQLAIIISKVEIDDDTALKIYENRWS